ncbi:hypothetical protein KIL84_023432 [Mauremys mutica]|uniref:Uncharacterized protein n=1 Tax=Mauremys mutica TaxID=74926 RepID=A0A9D3WSL3_9SAUR|nr:hypothetical protein KIL84_023432 [Mauremys mutica]
MLCVGRGGWGGEKFLRAPGPLLVLADLPASYPSQHSVQSQAQSALSALGSRNKSSLRLQWPESGFLTTKHVQEVDAVVPRSSKFCLLQQQQLSCPYNSNSRNPTWS